MKKSNYSKGYSIIELLVYIALFVLISLVVVKSLIYMMKTYSDARSFRTVQQNGELVMERLTREIRQANTVSVAGSAFGSSPGTLSLSGKDNSNAPYTAVASLVNGVAQLTINGVSSSLSSDEVSISNLTFWNITTATSNAIKLQLTLTTTNAPVVTKSFYTTVVLRE